MATVEILGRPMYSMAEAAGLLRLPANTLRRWLEGARVSGRWYDPVIRAEPTGSDAVTWGEFVEAGFLREYRLRRVALPHMRNFISKARREFDVPYPLAHFRPLLNNRELVWRLQLEVELEPELFLVRVEDEQLILTEVVRGFLEKVEFSPDDVVARLRPLGRDTPVVIDPTVAFGIPHIRGIRTELVAESVEVGGYEEAQASWGLKVPEIDAAVEFQQWLGRAA
jgi:uncharacterized protein (DUF433 family)